MSIHPTAIVHPKAALSEDVEVQAYSVIGAHVQIGPGTVVGPHCVIEGRTTIGRNNRLFSGTQIGVLCQDLKHREGLIGRACIGNGNTFREHVTISASTMEGYDDEHRVTAIGDHCLFMACAHVGHDCHLGNRVIIANGTLLAGHVEIEDNAQLSGLCGVHQECAIGTMAYVGGCSRINKDVPPYMLVEGNPARCGGPNTVGLRRNGLDGAARARIKAMYRIMYRSDLNTTQALHEIEASVEDSEERTHFLEFVRKSIRGIVK
ncbi:MAG TPA: acyl-ACP--UDP-N-acetylglucosamine O-acyltransferase [Candidatus Hydrogenedentes bacterium]|nr:acyl-ACP--UDP-N-acetylglucosamine O-acyltransferase [Candidatus Hydrogenedentota bacterium]HIJ74229.1 acyl-ACP--UDP-N-acetylglucosamine O-acyltransferase [Candidatus Hydrogenedentota bacterium]